MLRARKLLDKANGQSCVKCGSVGTVCARHYNGPRQHALGKGMGTKAHDLATAELCDKCDAIFSEGSCSVWWNNRSDRSEEFLYLITLTNIRRFDRGDLR